ncbi:MAG: hypothetical protein JWP29_1987 [Rhodoferax sp.]|nr:hypothetical protein [Rhodoferax sp.]
MTQEHAQSLLRAVKVLLHLRELMRSQEGCRTEVVEAAYSFAAKAVDRAEKGDE